MRLRTRLNLVLAALTGVFVLVLMAEEIANTRAAVREELEAANQVASQLLGRLAFIYSRAGGTEVVLQFLRELGHIRANDIELIAPSGALLYHSPPFTYKAGREAPAWFTRMLAPHPSRHIFALPGGERLVIEGQPSRAILDAWDGLMRLVWVALGMLLLVNVLAFWSVERALAPFPVIVDGLGRLRRGELAFRLPALAGFEAGTIGAAFNDMAAAVQKHLETEHKAREAESRLEERRDLARIVEQRIEEERRLIAHELHDEFGQSVTAIRSLAQAIVSQAEREPAREAARLISTEAARLYDAMHGLIPRLMPVSLDTLGLADTLTELVRDWQRRFPAVRLGLEQALPPHLGPSVTLAAYRVVQEGLVNALRHAQPAEVRIDLREEAGALRITIEDDGTGLPADWSRAGHFGLRGLKERVLQLGGQFGIENRSPRGVRLSASIPLGGAA